MKTKVRESPQFIAGECQIADTGNHRICQVTPDGLLLIIAGTGENGFNGDGRLAVTAMLNFPGGLSVAAAGNLFVADTGNNRIRKIAMDTGIMTTVAGGKYGYGGDGGQATKAQLKNPKGLTLDASGNLLIADTGNHCIRKVTPSGIISTVVGSGTAGNCCSTATAAFATFNSPTGVSVDAEGNLFITDSGNNQIREVKTNGDMKTLTSRTDSFTETGLGIEAQLKLPSAVIVDRAGNLFIADTENHRIATLLIPGVAATVEAAWYSGSVLASEAIVAAFGVDLAVTTESASSVPLPVALKDTNIRVVDSAGIERTAPLFFVSPQQVNYQIPAGTAPGLASIMITSGSGKISISFVKIAAVGPGLFTADASGSGLPAAQLLRVRENGSLSYEPQAQFDAAAGKIIPVPIDPGADTDQLFLILFGMGLRARSSVAGITAMIGHENAEVLFAGPQGDFIGLDQVNVRIPRSLIGRGDVEVKLSVDERPTNSVRLNAGGASCHNSITPAAQSFTASGGPGTVTVNAANRCYWTTQSQADWITITASGNGNHQASFVVAVNSNISDRTGTLRIAGQILTISQSGNIVTSRPVITITRPVSTGAYTTNNFSFSFGGTASVGQPVAFRSGILITLPQRINHGGHGAARGKKQQWLLAASPCLPSAPVVLSSW